MLTITKETLEWANVTENQLLQDISIMLYQKGKLTFGQAAQTANMNYADFQLLLGHNQVIVHYGVNELMEDIQTIKSLKNGHS